MLAAMTQVEELQMKESEAKTMAEAVVAVADCYDHVPGMSESATAWTNLAMCLGMAYVPRAVAFRERKKHESK
ncbi:MAG: hypothetical protein ACRYGG_07430 [Janthinobacterium lividum]